MTEESRNDRETTPSVIPETALRSGYLESLRAFLSEGFRVKPGMTEEGTRMDPRLRGDDGRRAAMTEKRAGMTDEERGKAEEATPGSVTSFCQAEEVTPCPVARLCLAKNANRVGSTCLCQAEEVTPRPVTVSCLAETLSPGSDIPSLPDLDRGTGGIAHKRGSADPIRAGCPSIFLRKTQICQKFLTFM